MKVTASGRSNASRGCLIVFALPFALVGVAMAAWMAFGLARFISMQQWVAAPAHLESVELEEHSDSDSTTYRVVASYSYTFQDHTYRSTRVGVSGGADNIGSWQRRVYDELLPHKGAVEGVTCYVNPRDPREAVLNRELRLELLAFQMLFAVVFGGVGIGLMVGGFRGKRTARQAEKLAAANPGQPWLWKKEWAGGVLRSGGKAEMLVAVFFALFWNAVSWPILFVIPRELEKGNKAVLLALLFPMAGVGLLVWAVRATIRWIKFGTSTFQMAAVPGVIGGRVAGVVRVPRSVQPEEGFRVVLSCINRVTTGSGKSRNTSERALWQDEQMVVGEMLRSDPSSVMVPVLFHAPHGQPETTISGGNNEVLWRLEVRADIPGVDFVASFEVPVFTTPESSPDFKLDPALLRSHAVKIEPERVLAEERVVLERQSPHSLVVVFPRAARPAQALGATLFFAAWTAGVYFMATMGAPLAFPLLFGLIDLAILYGVLDAWFGGARIAVESGTLFAAGGMFGQRGQAAIPAAEVESVGVTAIGQGNNVQHEVVVRKRDGSSRKVGRPMARRSAAQAVADLLQERLRT
jgi:hypothetical protein